MTDSSASFHEDVAQLKPETQDKHRAIVSIMEELEAVDWYDQRVDAALDTELAEILAHNRDEEKEHAAMLIEWLRRRDSGFDERLKTYLFTDEPVLDVEAAAEEAAGAAAKSDGSLNIGSLKTESSA